MEMTRRHARCAASPSKAMITSAQRVERPLTSFSQAPRAANATLPAIIPLVGHRGRANKLTTPLPCSARQPGCPVPNHLRQAVDDIRAATAFVFRANPARRDEYPSMFLSRSPRQRPAIPQPQDELPVGQEDRPGEDPPVTEGDGLE